MIQKKVILSKPAAKPAQPKNAAHPLYKPAVARMEQGSAATTVRNRIVAGKPIPVWAIKDAGLKKK
jgi:hypothetical protein